MNISLVQHFLTTYWSPILITTGVCILYYLCILWYGKISFMNGLTLFFTGIIVVTCIFLPFSWSIQNSDGSGKELFLFFFSVNIEGNNFIRDIKDFLPQIGIPLEYSEKVVTFFLAFLEELFKLTLLILCIRKSLRLPVIITYIFLVTSGWHSLTNSSTGIFLNILFIVGSILMGIILWIMLGRHIQTESVSKYMMNIAIVALGFAFAENIKYIYDLSKNGNTVGTIMHNALLRSLFGYLSHVFFSLVSVALYARGRFAFLRSIDNSGKLTLAQKALGWKWYTQLTSAQGFWTGVIVSAIIHGIYNIKIGQDILVPSMIILIGFVFLELFVLHDLRNNTKYGNLENYLRN